MRADLIVVIMNGQVVEQGSHTELIQSKGKYHSLWSKQIFLMPKEPTVATTPAGETDVTSESSTVASAEDLGTVMQAEDEAQKGEEGAQKAKTEAKSPPKQVSDGST